MLVKIDGNIIDQDIIQMFYVMLRTADSIKNKRVLKSLQKSQHCSATVLQLYPTFRHNDSFLHTLHKSVLDFFYALS